VKRANLRVKRVPPKKPPFQQRERERERENEFIHERRRDSTTTTTTTTTREKKKKKMTEKTTTLLFSLTRSTVSSVMTLLGAGLTVTFSQAMFLHYSYEPIEEEPTRGTSFKGLARCRFVEEEEEDKEVKEEEQNKSTFATKMISRTKRTTTTKGRRGKSKERKRVVIVGDSLATGVGCTTNTPALARIVAERLAELLSVEIEWIAVGKKGAALSDISSCVLPELRESNNSRRSVSNSNDSSGSSGSRSSNSSGNDSVENEVEEKEEDKNAQNEFLFQQRQQQQQQQQQQQASSSCARKADAVIILCGINDVKTCFLHGKIFFRENFENELENVIKEIKSVVGSDALVVLPGNPLHIAPLFPNPLREVILKLNDCWDDKKEKIANKLGKRKALFINSPTLQALRDAVRMHGGDSGGGIREGEFTARDGVHPNDMGYKAWANIIAAEVAKVLKDNEVQ